MSYPGNLSFIAGDAGKCPFPLQSNCIIWHLLQTIFQMNPLDTQLAGLSLTEANGQVFLNIQPVEYRAPVDADALHALLVREGYGNCLFHEDAIAKAAKDCNSLASPWVVLLANRIDAKVEVRIAPDQMKAEIKLTPAHGGKAAAMQDVLQALADAGVVFGIDELALIHACELGDCDGIPVASGELAQDGRDTQF